MSRCLSRADETEGLRSLLKSEKFDYGRLAANGLCAGCGLCAAVSGGLLAMRINASGYLRPVSVRAERLPSEVQADLLQSCPAVVLSLDSEPHAQVTTLWGPVVRTRAGHATDEEVRHRGSSGGAISALALHLLSTRQVDGVAQITASKEDPLRNDLQISRTRDDVLRAAGSRYAPAAPLEPLFSALETDQRLAFIGKPCDVAALRQYIRLNPLLQANFPILISFMCAGVPSARGTAALLKQMGADRSKLVSFRYRGDGWPGMARAVQSDGQVFEMDYNKSWGGVLGKHLQFRCKICPDGTGEFADIVCADAWYGADGYPDFAEQAGRSLVMTRTRAGEALVQSAMNAGAIEAVPLAIEQVAAMQPYQVTRKRMVLGRTLAARLALGSAPRYRRLRLLRSTLGARPLAWLRQVWGTFKRSSPEPQ